MAPITSKFFRLILTHNRGIGILHRTHLTVAHGDTSNRAMKRFLGHSLIRAYAEGAAGLFDIFGNRARTTPRSTPEDDARNLHRDLEKIGQDFASVLSKEPVGSDK